jgi:hypothetical protein
MRADNPNVGTVVTTRVADPVLDSEAAGFGALTVVAPWDRPEDLLAALVRSRPQASRRSGRVR